MTGPIDHSVTLEDVFAVVNAKRVPLAPELAGYLTLEVAEGAQTLGGGEVDPRSVYVGEEGTVALVRTKPAGGDPEGSVRSILFRLLEASGSQTPALGAAARRRPGGGLLALVEELEAALIPVNRAAGRRALARLAREVKRVTAGVGRNAPPPDRPAPHAPPRPVPQAPPIAAAPPPQAAPPPASSPKLERTPTPAAADVDPFPDLELVLPRGPSSARDVPTSPPKANEQVGNLPTVDLQNDEIRAVLTPQGMPGGDAVDQLLASFEVSGAGTDRAVSRELKAMVGLEPTPSPPKQAPGLARPPTSDDVEVLLAMTDQSIPIANVRRPPTPMLEPPAMPRPPPASAPPHRVPPPQPMPLLQPSPPPMHPQPPNMAPPLLSHPQHQRPTSTPPPRISGPPMAMTSQPPFQPQPMQQAHPSQPPQPRLPPRESRHAKTVVLPRESARKRARRVNTVLSVLTLLVLAAGAVAVWMLKPGFFTGRTPEKVEQERQAALAASLAAQSRPPPVKCRGALTVADVPATAEVLMRVGQAPVDIDRMPVGARLEFVATAEGFAPRRSIIPAAAPWDPGPDGKPRFELAVQLDPSRAKPGGVDPWPAGEPGSVVGGKGAPGTVRVVSTPRGAEMWLLVGAGPEATLDPIKCEQDTEILVAGPTTFRKRLKITSVDVNKAPIGPTGAHAIRMSVKQGS